MMAKAQRQAASDMETWVLSPENAVAVAYTERMSVSGQGEGNESASTLK